MNTKVLVIFALVCVTLVTSMAQRRGDRDRNRGDGDRRRPGGGRGRGKGKEFKSCLFKLGRAEDCEFRDLCDELVDEGRVKAIPLDKAILGGACPRASGTLEELEYESADEKCNCSYCENVSFLFIAGLYLS